MTKLQWLLPGCGIALGILSLPRGLDAFTPGFESLPLSQRDVRVFNNFTDAQSNSNTTPDPQFPGAVGAELACWKAIVEWGSALHGDGTGDPHQPGDLGSGGANFDATWQGTATNTGGINSNVISEFTGTNVGVIGFLDAGPTATDGWRIRLFQDPWILHDEPSGPTASTSLDLDLQGLVTQLYGLVIGLLPSNVPGATMSGVTSDGVALRSIEADDVAAIQFLYGVASLAKPTITAVTHCNGFVTLEGQSFDVINNEVWFTHQAPSPDGQPPLVIANGLAGGTRITVLVPFDAGPGDVLVKTPGPGSATLSNAFPFDPSVDDCSASLSSFCFGNGDTSPCTDCPCGNNAPPGTEGGCLNGSATSCSLLATGFPSSSADTLRFDVTGANPLTFAILISADNALPASSPNCPPGSGILGTPGLDGLRCVGGNLVRHGTRATGASGQNVAPWGPPGNPVGGLIAQGDFFVGQVRNFQAFYREVAALGCGTGQNTSNAVGVTIAP